MLFRSIWVATHYHVKRSCAGYFDSLLPASSAIEELLELFRRESSTVHLMRGKDRKTGSDSYRLVDGSLDLVRIRNDFADGYTIILGGVERFVRAIASLAHFHRGRAELPDTGQRLHHAARIARAGPPLRRP